MVRELSNKKIFVVIGTTMLILIAISILLIMFMFKSLFIGTANNQIVYSKGIKESKANNLFLGYYRPLKDSLVLDKLKIKSEKIWLEKEWRWEHSMFAETTKKTFAGIHGIAPFPILLSTMPQIEVITKQELPTCKRCLLAIDYVQGLGFAFYMPNNPDTITLLFGRKSELGFLDSCQYVKE